MSGPQFFHLQSYSRKPNKAGQNVEQVLAEAARIPEFSGHVENPKPPNIIFGMPPAEVERRHEEMVAQGHVDVTLADGSTARRGIRKDRHTLMTAVASYPLLSEQVAEGSESHEAYQEWVALNIRLLQAMFGDRLVSVIEHVDEEHPHIHAFILPLGDQSCSARHLNPAWQAKEESEALAKDSGHSPKAAVKLGNAAYKAKAREIQDEYYQHVGLPAGLTRTGPKRERLSRAQWKARKAAARREADLLRQMAHRVDLIADSEVGFERAANQKAEEIAAKFELAECFLKDAEAARDEAQRAAGLILLKAERAAKDTKNAAQRGLLNAQNDLQAQKVKLSRERVLFEREKERMLSKSVQETAIVAAKVILGTLVVADLDKLVREMSLSVNALETRAGILSGALGSQEKGFRRIQLRVFATITATGISAALILAAAFWLGTQIRQEAQNEASVIRDTNAVEVAQVRQMGESALADLKVQIFDQRAKIEREIGSVGADLTILTEDRDTVRAELEQFVALRDRVGFQMLDYRERTIIIVPEGERLRRWRAPELSELTTFNGRMYRLSD